MIIELAFLLKMLMIFGLIFLLAVLTPIVAKIMDRVFKVKHENAHDEDEQDENINDNK